MSSNGVCVPQISFDIPSVSLPFGIQFQAVADFSKGPPTQCAMLSSLMVQIMPALAAFSPIMKIIGIIQAIPDLIGPPPNPGEFLSKLNAVIELIDPFPIIEAVKSILLLVISYLQCFIQTIEGLLAFQASIDLSVAVGNPGLQASLQCASSNAAASINQVMQSLGPVGPLLQLMQPFMSIANISFTLPSVASLQAAQSVEEALQTLSKTLTDLQQVLEALP